MPTYESIDSSISRSDADYTRIQKRHPDYENADVTVPVKDDYLIPNPMYSH